MALKFYFDECSDEDICAGLRAHGIDVVTASEIGHKGLKDIEILQFAKRENRIIYTVDRHFLVLASRWLKEGIEFPGIVYHAQNILKKGEMIRALLLLTEVYTPSDMRNRVEFL